MIRIVAEHQTDEAAGATKDDGLGREVEIGAGIVVARRDGHEEPGHGDEEHLGTDLLLHAEGRLGMKLPLGEEVALQELEELLDLPSQVVELHEEQKRHDEFRRERTIAGEAGRVAAEVGMPGALEQARYGGEDARKTGHGNAGFSQPLACLKAESSCNSSKKVRRPSSRAHSTIGAYAYHAPTLRRRFYQPILDTSARSHGVRLMALLAEEGARWTRIPPTDRAGEPYFPSTNPFLVNETQLCQKLKRRFRISSRLLIAPFEQITP